MNPRWREIAINCWDERTDGLHFDQELFAELIVRECICQCDDENSQKYIMSHFGFTEKDWS
jgi:hypothetical protein